MHNPAKVALRKQIDALLKTISIETRKRQSELIAQKVYILRSFYYYLFTMSTK